jgi:hypothetical protein
MRGPSVGPCFMPAGGLDKRGFYGRSEAGGFIGPAAMGRGGLGA